VSSVKIKFGALCWTPCRQIIGLYYED